MISKILFAVALSISSVAMAVDGTAQLDVSGWGSGFNVSRTGDTITGWVSVLGGSTGKVSLTKKSGRWSGRMGLHRVNSGDIRKGKGGKSSLDMNVFPGGQSRFSISEKSNKLSISSLLFNGDLVRAGLSDNGDELFSSNRAVSMSLRKYSSGNYQGETAVTTNEGQETFRTSLKSTGSLQPSELAKTDQALFVLLYMVSFNLQ